MFTGYDVEKYLRIFSRLNALGANMPGEEIAILNPDDICDSPEAIVLEAAAQIRNINLIPNILLSVMTRHSHIFSHDALVYTPSSIAVLDKIGVGLVAPALATYYSVIAKSPFSKKTLLEAVEASVRTGVGEYIKFTKPVFLTHEASQNFFSKKSGEIGFSDRDAAKFGIFIPEVSFAERSYSTPVDAYFLSKNTHLARRKRPKSMS